MSKESKKNINNVLNSGQTVIIDITTGFLGNGELFGLALSSWALKGAIANINWKARIKQHIGPDIKLLMKEGETFQQTYLRHQTIISALPSIASITEMGKRLTKYPCYYYQTIVKNTDFGRVISGYYILECFCKEFPNHAEAVIQRVLDNAADFARVISSRYNLKFFCEEFPNHAEVVIQRVLDNAADFARLIRNPSDLKGFCETFPSHAEAVIQRVLDNAGDFARIIRDPSDLKDFCKAFPNHAEAVIQRVLDNAGDFARVIRNPSDLKDFCETFPNHAKTATRIFADNSFLPVTSVASHQVGTSLNIFSQSDSKRNPSSVLSRAPALKFEQG